MVKSENNFRYDVYALVEKIPRGRVMTYGQIAALCGHPRASRQVGQIAHYGPLELPWHRVVNKQGGLARGFPGGVTMQGRLLSEEGVEVSQEYTVQILSLMWYP